MKSTFRHHFSHDQIWPIHERRKKDNLETSHQKEWKILYKIPYISFTEEFRSNQEMKTCMLWQEWGEQENNISLPDLHAMVLR